MASVSWLFLVRAVTISSCGLNCFCWPAWPADPYPDAGRPVHERGPVLAGYPGRASHRLPQIHERRPMQGPGLMLHRGHREMAENPGVQPVPLGQEEGEVIRVGQRLPDFDGDRRGGARPRARVVHTSSGRADPHRGPVIGQTIREARPKDGHQARRVEREEPDSWPGRPPHVGPQVHLGKVREPGNGRQERRPEAGEMERSEADPGHLLERVDRQAVGQTRLKPPGITWPVQERDPAPPLEHRGKPDGLGPLRNEARSHGVLR